VQIVLQTPSELVVHDGRWMTVLMGALFTAMGGGVMWLRITHPTGWSGNGGPWLIYVVGTMFVLVGMLIFWLSADRRYVIDRGAHTVSMIVQRLVHRTTTLIAFKDIDDVVLEQAQSMSTSTNPNQQSMGTYRVVFLMKDGSRVPWTPYSTNDRESQERCCAAARTFGGWAGNPEHQIAPTTPTPAILSHPVATNWGCLAAFLSIFVAIGLGLFTLQVYRVLSWRPVSARVALSGVAAVQGNKGTSYKPVVEYDYTYNGQPYRAFGVTPITISASQSWAKGIADRYKPGDITTAYVNPDRPNNAFLLRKVSTMPLIFVFFPVGFGLLFSWIIRVQRRQVVLAEKHLVPVVNSV
jgi:uncharacterized protein DUF3592